MLDAVSVICVGEILEDWLADQSDRAVESVTAWTAYLGGAPANVACGLVKLGTPSAFIGCVGRDRTGQESIERLDRLGVDTTAVQYHPTAPTRHVYVTRSTGGERHFAGFGAFPTTAFADTALNADDLPAFLGKKGQFLVTGTLGLAYPQSRQAIVRAWDLAHRCGAKVFIDINWRPVFWTDTSIALPTILDYLPRADLIKCSEEEARWLFGTDHPGDISQKFPSLQGILVTAGERGCRYRIGENEGTVAAFPVMAVDTTGAGDGFSAGFLHQYGQIGEAILTDARLARDAVAYACAVGAMVTRAEGAIDPQPTSAEVAAFLDQRFPLSF